MGSDVTRSAHSRWAVALLLLLAACLEPAPAARLEPGGTVYGEAMAFGLPVVGWRAGNLPYLAEHEREGLLIRPGDLKALTASLQRLAADADLRARLGRAAKARALARPTWDEVAASFFDRLREVVAAPQARSPL